MIVHKRKKCLILKLREPGQVMSVIPTAREFKYKGINYVAVKHGSEETKVLRNIGIDAPAPISYYYDWPGTVVPFDAQKEAAAFLSMENRAFNLSDLGTGKTLATLWAYDYLRNQKLLHRALIITPLSTLERTWADEIFTHFPHLTVSVVYGTREQRAKTLAVRADIYLVNHDGIKVGGVIDALKGRNDIDLIVIDEIAQVARNAGTDRWRSLATICNKQVPRRVWGMTGTPTPNNPTDAWAQCRLMVPERVPPYYNRFREQVMRQINQFLWVPRTNAIEIVHEAMQPAVRFTRDECMDLPPVMYETRTTELSSEQRTAYKEMMNKMCIEAAEGTITAINEAVKAQKLIQVVCGVVYGTNDQELSLDAGPRMDVLMQVIEEAPSKVIVFVPFVSAVTAVASEVSSRLHSLDSVAVIHGGVKKNERDRIFGAFQNSTYPKVLVAQPGAMSHGLNLTAASTIVWYAPITSNETYVQANGRITRPGQKLNQLIIMIEGTVIERKYYQRLKNKERLQGLLLDMVKEMRIAA